MRIGPLRHRVQHQVAAVAEDALNGTSESWTTSATVWAEVASAESRERLVAESLRAEASHVVTVRGRLDPGPGPLTRFVWQGRVLNVLAAYSPDNRGIRTVCVCREVLSGA